MTCALTPGHLGREQRGTVYLYLLQRNTLQKGMGVPSFNPNAAVADLANTK